MRASNIFSGRSYVFDENREITSKNKTQHELLLKILSKLEANIKPSKITDIYGNENLDQYKIESQNGLLYTLKISLDKDCEVLLSEIDFLKNNKSPFIPHYYESGLIQIGMPILYILTSYEEGFSIDEFGQGSIIKNSESFFYTLKHFGDLKTENTFSNYIETIFNCFSTKNSSDFLKSSISKFHNFDQIDEIFTTLENKTRSLSIYFGDETKICHGMLTKNDLTTRNLLYKFKNFGYCFVGDPIYDLCFLSISCGYNPHNSIIFFKKYCEFNDIDFHESIPKYKLYSKTASCVFLTKMLFEFLIEESVFATSRANKLVESSIKLSGSFRMLNELSIPEDTKRLIQKIITRPITDKKKR